MTKNIRILTITLAVVAALVIGAGAMFVLPRALPLVHAATAPKVATTPAPAAVPAPSVSPSSAAPTTEESPVEDDTTTDADSKYRQTWTTPYGATTCADWNDEMDAHQQYVMAGDFLVGMNKDSGVPTDELINTMKSLLGSMCEDDETMMVTMAGGYLFQADKSGMLKY